MLQNIKNILHGVSAHWATIRYGYPAKSMKVIGVTGTDGKTTTSELIYHLLSTAGKKVSIISTVKAVINGKEYDTGFHVTTPSSFALQKFFSLAKKGGSEFMVLEVTSHAIDQRRITGVNFDVGVITNISHEHLDYHKTYERYVQTKAKLFKKTRFAIINRDDANFETFKKASGGTVITYGLKKGDINSSDTNYETSLIGQFNTYNILASIAVARLYKIDEETIKKGIKSFQGIKGRMEKVNIQRDFQVIVDFAHKPNALENALKAARTITKNKLIVVFGAAGLRDKLKRPMMGKIAGIYADIAVLTAEDPRTEDVRDIIQSISIGAKAAGMYEAVKQKNGKDIKKGKKYFYRVPDRQEAINFAIKKLAHKGDVLVLAGKGHETSMCYGKVEYPWDEFKAIQKAL